MNTKALIKKRFNSAEFCLELAGRSDLIKKLRIMSRCSKLVKLETQLEIMKSIVEVANTDRDPALDLVAAWINERLKDVP